MCTHVNLRLPAASALVCRPALLLGLSLLALLLPLLALLARVRLRPLALLRLLRPLHRLALRLRLLRRRRLLRLLRLLPLCPHALQLRQHGARHLGVAQDELQEGAWKDSWWQC